MTTSGDRGTTAGSSSRTARLSRRSVVVLVGVAVALLAVVTSVPWVVFSTWTPLEAATSVVVRGGQAAPPVGAATFVVASAAVALALARRWGRLVAAGGIGLGGLLAAAATVQVVRDPERVAVAAAREAVGVGAVTSPVQVTAMPWVALTAAVALTVLAVLVVVLSSGWAPPSGRHEPGTPSTVESEDGPRPGADADSGPRDADRRTWDALTRGEDPTGGGS